MSLIPSRTAGALLRMTPSYFGRLMKRFGLKPVARRLGTGGQPEKLWSKCQLLGLMTAGALVRVGVSMEWADAFPAVLAGTYSSDEQLEATLDSGRRYLLVAGANVLPGLLTEDELNERVKENRPTLEAFGIETARVDLAELFRDLMESVRAARAAEEFA